MSFSSDFIIHSLPPKMIYITDEGDKLYRYALGYLKDENILYIGANPSTATISKSDKTISQIKEFSLRLGNYGMIMTNLYPQRATDPINIDQMPNMDAIETNVAVIQKVVSDNGVRLIIPCWGNLITTRSFFKTCAFDLISLTRNSNEKPSYQTLGTLTKLGHPRHPSRLAYSTPSRPFDVEKYISTLNAA